MHGHLGFYYRKSHGRLFEFACDTWAKNTNREDFLRLSLIKIDNQGINRRSASYIVELKHYLLINSEEIPSRVAIFYMAETESCKLFINLKERILQDNSL